MTPKERAEKMSEFLVPLVDRSTYLIDFLSAQIEEAEGEAAGQFANHYSQSVDKAYAEGFRVAQEKAAVITESLEQTVLGKEIAKRIREMGPE